MFKLIFVSVCLSPISYSTLITYFLCVKNLTLDGIEPESDYIAKSQKPDSVPSTIFFFNSFHKIKALFIKLCRFFFISTVMFPTSEINL